MSQKGPSFGSEEGRNLPPILPTLKLKWYVFTRPSQTRPGGDLPNGPPGDLQYRRSVFLRRLLEEKD